MRLFKVIVAFLAIFGILVSGVSAQTPAPIGSGLASPTPVDYQLAFPGVLPDHPLYPVKKIRDWLLISLNSEPLKKAEIYLLFADKKISMASQLSDRRKTDLAARMIFESQSDFLKAAEIIPELNDVGRLPEGFADKISLAGKKHLEVMSRISLLVPGPPGAQKIKQALELNNQADGLLESIRE